MKRFILIMDNLKFHEKIIKLVSKKIVKFWSW